MKIVIVGTGYVGLVTGVCFAEVGINVTCVDIDKNKIALLKEGILPIYEPGLDKMMERNMLKERLSFSYDLKTAIKDASIVFIAVGTPSKQDGSADLKYVFNVAEEIGNCIEKHVVVATKSTVPVGTSKMVRETIEKSLIQRGISVDFDVVSNPEFLKEGAAINDFLKPDRIVVGVERERARFIMARLYKPFTLNDHPIVFMDLCSAEMTKYVANALLATKISFMNEVANLCEKVGANVNLVRKGIGSDPRIGKKFIYPGIGYGGSCFPKDVRALINTAKKYSYNMQVLKAVDEVNRIQKKTLFGKISNFFGNEKLKGMHFGLWGLSFKPNTNDMREAPSLDLIKLLLHAGATVSAYDPIAMRECQVIIGDRIEYCKDEYEALKNADALIIATEWSEFRYPNFKLIQEMLKAPVVFDGRNIFESQEMEALGFKYFGIGI